MPHCSNNPETTAPPSWAGRSAITLWHLLLAAGIVSLGLLFFQSINGGPFRAEVALDPNDIRETEGHGHRWRMPNRDHSLAMKRHPFRRAQMFEDGAPIGPSLTGRPGVTDLGRGRFYVTERGNLWFSTSDNSLPQTNGRRYTVRIAREPGAWHFAGAAVLVFAGLAGCLLSPRRDGAPPLKPCLHGWSHDRIPRVCPERRPLVVAIIATLLVASRIPHILANASFWSEDGSVFFAAAWQGEHNVLAPYAGYLHGAPRLVASMLSVFPLEWQPLLYLLSCLAVFFLVAFYIATAALPGGLAWILPLAMAAAPHQGEVFQGICLLHYIFTPALVAAALAPGRTAARSWSDAAIIAAAGISGPQILLLLPLFWCGWFINKRPGPPWAALLATAMAALQLSALLGFAAHQRSLARMLEPTQMFDALVNGLAAPMFCGDQLARWFPVSTGVVGVTLVLAVAGLALANRRTRSAALFLGFAAGIMAAASLASPTGGITTFHIYGPGQRYWYVPAVVILSLAVMIARASNRWWMWLPVALLLLSSVANWQWERTSSDLVWRPQALDLLENGSAVVHWRPAWSMQLEQDPRRAKMLYPPPNPADPENINTGAPPVDSE